MISDHLARLAPDHIKGTPYWLIIQLAEESSDIVAIGLIYEEGAPPGPPVAEHRSDTTAAVRAWAERWARRQTN